MATGSRRLPVTCQQEAILTPRSNCKKRSDIWPEARLAGVSREEATVVMLAVATIRPRSLRSDDQILIQEGDDAA